jgi:hypothetical protein
MSFFLSKGKHYFFCSLCLRHLFRTIVNIKIVGEHVNFELSNDERKISPLPKASIKYDSKGSSVESENREVIIQRATRTK